MVADGNVKALESSAAYAEKHQVFQLFEGLLQDLLINKPQDPIGHLVKALKTPSVPRVVVAAHPSVDAFTQCELLALRMGLVLVNEPELWREAAKAGTAKAPRDRDHAVRFVAQMSETTGFCAYPPPGAAAAESAAEQRAREGGFGDSDAIEADSEAGEDR